MEILIIGIRIERVSVTPLSNRPSENLAFPASLWLSRCDFYIPSIYYLRQKSDLTERGNLKKIWLSGEVFSDHPLRI